MGGSILPWPILPSDGSAITEPAARPLIVERVGAGAQSWESADCFEAGRRVVAVGVVAVVVAVVVVVVVVCGGVCVEVAVAMATDAGTAVANDCVGEGHHPVERWNQQLVEATNHPSSVTTRHTPGISTWLKLPTTRALSPSYAVTYLESTPG
jgi:hypothetical protein